MTPACLKLARQPYPPGVLGSTGKGSFIKSSTLSLATNEDSGLVEPAETFSISSKSREK